MCIILLLTCSPGKKARRRNFWSRDRLDQEDYDALWSVILLWIIKCYRRGQIINQTCDIPEINKHIYNKMPWRSHNSRRSVFLCVLFVNNIHSPSKNIDATIKVRYLGILLATLYRWVVITDRSKIDPKKLIRKRFGPSPYTFFVYMCPEYLHTYEKIYIFFKYVRFKKIMNYWQICSTLDKESRQKLNTEVA